MPPVKPEQAYGKLIVNNGNLVNENDMKLDYDPTENLRNSLNIDIEITYKQLLGETMKFIRDNGKYLEYPKLYPNTQKTNCNTTHCAQCNSKSKSNTTTKTSVFSLCEVKRRQIGNELYVTGQQRSCCESIMYA